MPLRVGPWKGASHGCWTTASPTLPAAISTTDTTTAGSPNPTSRATPVDDVRGQVDARDDRDADRLRARAGWGRPGGRRPNPGQEEERPQQPDAERRHGTAPRTSYTVHSPTVTRTG